MAKQKKLTSLKSENNKLIWLCMATNVIVINFLFFNELNPVFQVVFFSGVGSLSVVLLNHLFSSSVKSVIVFWRIKDVLPGHRAFSKYAKEDPRINISALEAKMGSLPVSPKDQNTSWYKLLQKHQADVRVKDAHKNFLLFRDLSSLVLLILVVTEVVAVAMKFPQFVQGWLLLGLTIEFIWFTISARNTGIGLVKNVLSLESSSFKKKK